MIRKIQAEAAVTKWTGGAGGRGGCGICEIDECKRRHHIMLILHRDIGPVVD